MNRDHEAKSKLSIFLTYPVVIIINQSFVLNCFFLKECTIYQNLKSNNETIRMYNTCRN